MKEEEENGEVWNPVFVNATIEYDEANRETWIHVHVTLMN